MRNNRKSAAGVTFALMLLCFGAGVFVSTVFSAEVLVVVASVAAVLGGLILLFK